MTLRQRRPFAVTITAALKRKLREDSKRFGVHYGVFFDTSGKAHTERVNPTRQYNYVWQTDATAPTATAANNDGHESAGGK